MKVHLVNGGKYFSVIMIQFANIFKTKLNGNTSLALFFILSMISTIYAYSWDLYMDWGLLRSNEAGKKYLRPKFLFPRWFYYYAMISNLFLRFLWIIILISGLPNWVHNT